MFFREDSPVRLHRVRFSRRMNEECVWTTPPTWMGEFIKGDDCYVLTTTVLFFWGDSPLHVGAHSGSRPSHGRTTNRFAGNAIGGPPSTPTYSLADEEGIFRFSTTFRSFYFPLFCAFLEIECILVWLEYPLRFTTDDMYIRSSPTKCDCVLLSSPLVLRSHPETLSLRLLRYAIIIMNLYLGSAFILGFIHPRIHFIINRGHPLWSRFCSSSCVCSRIYIYKYNLYGIVFPTSKTMISLVFNTQKEQEGTEGDDDEEATHTVEEE